MLFDLERGIPLPQRPPTLPAARAAEEIAPFRAVLDAAEAVSLADLAFAAAGRSATIGGARIAADPLLPGDALLDDGSAVVPIVLRRDAPASLRTALAGRFVLAVGSVAEHEGFVTLVADDVRDLRQLEREWKAITRR